MAQLKMGKYFSRHFSEEGEQMARECLGSCSTPRAVRKTHVRIPAASLPHEGGYSKTKRVLTSVGECGEVRSLIHGQWGSTAEPLVS